MTRFISAIFYILVNLNCFCQIKQTIYIFPGQGSDKRLFDSLSFDSHYNIKVIEYETPEKKMTMKSFAQQLSSQIDTTHEFILLGVSLGGMICVELSEILKPSKIIIISSAKNRKELPFRYKFQKIIPLYKLLPGSVILAGAKILQPIVEPDRNKNKKTFKSMLARKNSLYMKRTVGLIINWKRKNNENNIYQIHGNKDHTLPLRKIISPTYVVENGSHMMTLTRAKDISEILKLVLNL
jgi:pimeloyl-ACP methyl ester carboxylesterase